ncbi:MAG: hypothetical protein HUJ54_14940 [Erysipelotrichaceae bacterium]|nr:hypothetical protein [Erysipelotrichaceae bacterium]
MMISDPMQKTYHPFYGLPSNKLLHFLMLAAQDLGYSTSMDAVLQYGTAVLKVLECWYPSSLPALTQLLKQDDDRLSASAEQMNLSTVVSDTIRANHSAGLILRSACEKLQSVFDNTAFTDSGTKYSLISGSRGNVSVMAFYQPSNSQSLLNEYLKEELEAVLNMQRQIRVVLDEPVSVTEDTDGLMPFLFEKKRQGKIELVLISRNAAEALQDQSLSFSNTILSAHDEPVLFENLSRELWGTYQHSSAMMNVGSPPTLFGTPRKAVNWQPHTEERLKVRWQDLQTTTGLFSKGKDLLAVKTPFSNTIFLVPALGFLQS